MHTDSLADDFAHGKIKVTLPAPSHKVSYHIRIYPAIRVEISPAMQAEVDALMKYPGQHSQEDLDAILAKYDPLKPEYYGITAACDYCNDSTGEIVHRFELIRTTQEELGTALVDYAEQITDPRQRHVYARALIKKLK